MAFETEKGYTKEDRLVFFVHAIRFLDEAAIFLGFLGEEETVADLQALMDKLEEKRKKLKGKE